MAKSPTAVAASDEAASAPKSPRRRKKKASTTTVRPATQSAPTETPSSDASESSPAPPRSEPGGSGSTESGANRPTTNRPSYGGGGQQAGAGGRTKRRKNKRKKRPSTGAISLPAGAVPSDEELRAAAETIRESRQAATGKGKSKDAESVTLLVDLQRAPLDELHTLAEKAGLEDFHQLHKSDLVFRISKAQAEAGRIVIAEGTLEILPEGFGFLRSSQASYLSGPDDVYVTPTLIRRLKLRKGMIVRGPVFAPREGQQFFALVDVDSVNGQDPAGVANLPIFEDLTPLHPEERLVLETTADEIEMRVVDLVAPIGKGQRGLIVAPPRTGKTVLLQKMTRAISANHPGVHVIVLLIDERPEEVTDFRRNTPEAVEVVASTFDERSSRHVQVAEMVIEKARRMVEFGEDVVILLDSITRLARAYNNEMPHSGKIMTGGIDSGALQRPKKFFGAARAIEHGGSLTILATALVDTGSKADEVIFEEFKGTGNSELHLDRKLVEKRIWPAIDISASGTRREELLLDPKELELVYRLRKVLSDMNVVEAMELMKGRLGKTKTNAEFLMTMNLG